MAMKMIPSFPPRLPRAALGLSLAAFAVLLPLALLWTSWSALRVQEDQRQTWLRSRIGALAARLETLPELQPAAAQDILSAEEPALASLQILDARAPGDDLEAIWEGRQLFRMEQVDSPQGPVLRGTVPFHCGSGLCLARIELLAEAADFIVLPARRNLAASVAASAAVAVFGLLLWFALEARQRALLRQAELEHLAALGRLSAVLAHEIRNPLGTIKGFAQLIEEQASGAQQRLVAPIVAEAARLERLVNDLLAYGRPRQPVLTHAELRPLLEQVVAEHRTAAQPGPVEWQTDFQEAGLRVVTDLDLLRQVLGNLLRNAAEAAASSPEPRVTVIARRHGRHVQVEVRDNGPGFTAEALERSFEPFFTSKASGTGLGLAISRRLTASLGGTLEVRNLEGGGAAAILRLPRAPALP